MLIIRNLVIILLVGIVSACSGFRDFDEVEALNEAQAVGSPFTQRLTSEYRAYVDGEINEMNDYADGLHFARKGLASARGDVVMPEPVTDWNLLPRHINELGAARARLVNAFDLGGREIEPELSAVAQARFDCWIEQQEENWEGEIGYCKSQFMQAMQQLENALRNVAPPPAPEPEPIMAEPFNVDPAQPMQAENAMYLVFFDFDKHNLGPGAQSVLDAVSDEVRSRSINVVNVEGHADTSGPKAYNRRLAMKRANAVRDALIKRGVNGSIIRVESRGEEELLVDTADNVREPANRRGEITFQ